MRKKIMFYSMALIKGGTERVITNISNHFINTYDITIVSNINHKVEFELDKRIKTIFIDNKDKLQEKIPKKIFTKLGNSRTKKLKMVIQQENPNIIIVFLPEPSIRALSLKKYFKNIPILVAIRNHPKKEFITPLGKMIRNHYYKNADRIIIQDNCFKKYLPKYLHKKIISIPNYISNSFVNCKIPSKKEKKIVTVTRLEKQKNIPFLIHTFAKIEKKYKDYKLFIIGKGSKKRKLEKIIKKYNLEKKVFLCGTSNHIEEDIKNAKLFILPSNYEGMPNAILEAMSLSLPVIATNSSDIIPNIINHKENGIIIKKNNSKELIKSIEYLLENPTIANKIGKKGLQVRKKYNYQKIIKEWEKTISYYFTNNK